MRDYSRPMCSCWTTFLSIIPCKMCSPGYGKMCSSKYRMKNGLPGSFWSGLVPNSPFEIDWNCWAVELVDSRSDLVANSPFDIDWNYWAAESIDLKSAPAPKYDLKNCESQYDSNSSASTLNSLKAVGKPHRGTVHESPEHIYHDLRQHQPIGESARDGSQPPSGVGDKSGRINDAHDGIQLDKLVPKNEPG